MNRGGLAVMLTLLTLASLACNFLVPLPASRLTPGTATAVAVLSPVPASAIAPEPVAAAGAAPSVIGHAPDSGDVLLPSGAIDLYFDQDMEPQSVQAAFAITPSLAGRFSWPDTQTLRFTPGPVVQPSQSYTVTLGSSARNSGGKALHQPTVFGVQTYAPLAVARVYPAPGSSNLPPGIPITVMFNRPVVRFAASAAAAPGAGVPQPLELSPNVAGQGQWINSGTYQFQPMTTTLAAGTLYTARIGRSLTDVSGVSLAADYTWQFSTTAPAVSQVLPFLGASNVPVTTPLTLSFSQPMDTASVTAALELQTSAGAMLPGRLTWNEARTQATFAPNAPWPKATVIGGRLASSAAASGGLKLAADTTWDFSTVAPSIVASRPAADAIDVPLTTTVVLTFSQPMDRNSTEMAFSLTVNTDRIGGRVAWSDDNTRLIFTPDTRLPYGARLICALGQTARAADGTSPMADQVRAFTTVAAPAVDSTWPVSGAQGVASGAGSFSVRFASPMDPQALAQHIVIAPRPAKITLTSEGREATLEWDFGPDTKYTVTLEAALADGYDTRLGKDAVITFSTASSAALSQTVEFYPKGRFGTYSARLPTKVYVLYCGVSAYDTSLYRIRPQDLADLDPAKMTLLRRWRQTLPADGDGLAEVYLDPDQKPLPPGLYYVQVHALGASGGPAADAGSQVVVVADSNLTLKVSGEEVLVWATAYYTGKPIARRPIQIFDEALNLVGNGITDAKGLFGLPLPKASAAGGVYYALADGRTFGGYALTASDWSVGPMLATTAPYQVYLYTDRQVYRPGQTVFVKGIVRQEVDARYQLPQAPPSVAITFWNQDRQGALGAASPELSAFGTLAAEFTLPKEAAPGNYVVKANGTGLSGEVSFRVEDPPQREFRVTVMVDHAEAVVSDTVHLAVEARTFSGAALPGAAVDWAVSGVLTTSGTGVTDALGRFVQPITPTVAGRLVFAAQVTDTAGRRGTTQTSIAVHPGPVRVSVSPDRYLATAGQASAIQVLIRDWVEQPVSGQAVEVVIRHQEWRGGQPQWVEVGRMPLTTDKTGRAVAPFYPPRAGVYQIQAIVQDEAGHETAAETNLWALLGQGTAPVAAGELVTFGVGLVADQRLYHVGDLAEILISSPYTEVVRALITVERGQIFLAEVITVTSSSAVFSLPVLEAYAPNVFVNVVFMRGAPQGDLKTAFTSAQLNLPVTAEYQALHVQLTADKPHALPGDTVTFALTATDSLSRPVSAEFSLALADAAAPASDAPSAGEFFYGLQPLRVRTALGLKVSNDLLAPPVDRLPCQAGGGGASGGAATEGGGGSASGGGTATSVPQAAGTDFVDTAFWQASVTTDPSGRARVRVTLPTSLTTWRMDARGVTTDTQVGQATAEVVVNRPLVLRSIAPRFFVAGDQVTLGAVVVNNTPNAITARVVLSSTGVTLSGAATQQVSVPALGQARVEWPVTAQADTSGASAADLAFFVQGGGYADTSRPAEQPLPIFRYRAPEVETVAGELDQAGSRTETIVAPRRYQSSAGQLEVAVSPSTAAGQSASTAGSDFSVTLNDQPLMPTATITGTTWFTAPIKSGLNSLVVGRGAGAGTLYYTARLALYPEMAGLPALNRGIDISRQYFKLLADCGGRGQAPCPSVSEARVGDTLLVKLTLIVPHDTGNLLVEDYVPAGVEIAALPRYSGVVPSPIAYVPEADAGRFRAVVSAEKLTLLTAYLPAGAYEYTYEIVARVPGRYAVIPSLAQEFYSPAIYGRGAGATFTVLP